MDRTLILLVGISLVVFETSANQVKMYSSIFVGEGEDSVWLDADKLKPDNVEIVGISTEEIYRTLLLYLQGLSVES